MSGDLGESSSSHITLDWEFSRTGFPGGSDGKESQELGVVL